MSRKSRDLTRGLEGSFVSATLSKKRLLLKLAAIGLFLFILGMIARWLLVKHLAADHFASLLERHGLSSEPALIAAFVEAATHGLWWAHAVSFITAIAIAAMIGKVVIAPLHRVIVATRAVATGDFTPHVPSSWEDEIGELGKSFNAMTVSLYRMEELRKKLVLDIAHELRAPLTNMRGYLEAMQHGVIAPTPVIIESLKEETLRLGNLADNVMRLSIADAAAVTMRKEPADLRQLVTEALVTYSRNFAEKEIDVQVNLQDSIVVSADGSKLRQVVQNLLDNAWRYTPRRGRVTISVAHLASRLRVLFVNSGEAIAEEHLPHLFNRFYRAGRSHDNDGAGIGLAIVKELIAAHGGSVGARSAPHENCIWFELPIERSGVRTLNDPS